MDDETGITSKALEAHYLAGGNVPLVIRAIIAAKKAKTIDLDFKLATAIDLAGRDVLEAVQTSVYPKVIDCPARGAGSKIARRRGQERHPTQGESPRHGAHQFESVDRRRDRRNDHRPRGRRHRQRHRLVRNAHGRAGKPDRISKAVLARRLDSQTAFEIVSIDIADIDVGDNIGARLQADQAEADMRVARAKAEGRRAMAVAQEQENIAAIEESPGGSWWRPKPKCPRPSPRRSRGRIGDSRLLQAAKYSGRYRDAPQHLAV